MSHKDKQPRRPSKDLPLEKLHPASDMGKRAKGGDKFANPGVRDALGSKGAQSTPSRKGTAKR